MVVTFCCMLQVHVSFFLQQQLDTPRSRALKYWNMWNPALMKKAGNLNLVPDEQSQIGRLHFYVRFEYYSGPCNLRPLHLTIPFI